MMDSNSTFPFVLNTCSRVPEGDRYQSLSVFIYTDTGTFCSGRSPTPVATNLLAGTLAGTINRLTALADQRETMPFRNMTQFVKSLSPQVWLALTILWSSRILTWLAFPGGSRSPDSGGYAPDSWGDWSLVSFTGDAIRPWPVPLLFSSLPSDTVRVGFQLATSGLAWTLLIVILTSFCTTAWQRWALAGAGSAIASSPSLIQWDSVILAQSVQSSLVVLSIVLLIRAATRPPKAIHHAGFFIVLLLVAHTKSTHLILVVGFGVLYLIAGHRLHVIGLTTKILLWTLLVAVALSGIVLGRNIDRYWDYSYSGIAALYALGAQTPDSADFKIFVEERGAPPCLTATAPYGNWDRDVEGPVLKDCPEAKIFIRDRLGSLLVEYRLKKPISTINVGLTGIAGSFVTNGIRYGGVVSLVPQPVSGLFYGVSDPDIATLGDVDHIEISQAATSGAGFWLFTPQATWMILGFAASLRIFVKQSGASRKLGGLLLGVLLILAMETFATTALLSSDWNRIVAPYVNPMLLVALAAVVISARGVPRNNSV